MSNLSLLDSKFGLCGSHGAYEVGFSRRQSLQSCPRPNRPGAARVTDIEPELWQDVWLVVNSPRRESRSCPG